MTKCEAVIGLGFGDCGKGTVVDYLVAREKNTLVVRFSSGQNSGHTVCIAGKRHVFSNFGSGTLRGAPTYWSKFCTVDPVGLSNELHDLKELGVYPRIYINANCPVTTPNDKYANQTNRRDLENGTCGVGVGTTHQREADHYSLTFSDLYNPTVLAIKLRAIAQYYTVSVPNITFLECVDEIKRSSNIILAYKQPEGFSMTIFEGSQGLLLDQKYGFFPNVTRSSTGAQNLPGLTNAYLVTRSYQTRHGNGAMTNEHIPHTLKENPNETNQTNAYQGIFRRSLLDLDLLEYGINKDAWMRNNKSRCWLVITCLDHLEVTPRFTYRGSIVRCASASDFVGRVSDILGIDNVLTNDSPVAESMSIFRR